MLIAHVIFSVDESRRQDVLESLNKDAPVVRRMNGCIEFLPFANPTNPQEIGILHEWRSAEDFRVYTSSETFAGFQAEVLPLTTAPPVSRRFEAELVKLVN